MGATEVPGRRSDISEIVRTADWAPDDLSLKGLLGDSGPWLRYLPFAWRACAEPALSEPIPRSPTSSGPFQDERLGAAAAFWAPLLHLLHFGLGWHRADLGLERWHEMGRPTDDPILRVVDRWWGPEIPDLLALHARDGLLSASAAKVRDPGLPPLDRTREIGPQWARRAREPEWQRRWGGGDPLHLASHLIPSGGRDGPGVLFGPQSEGTGSNQRRQYVLVCETYVGWHWDLHQIRDRVDENGHSHRVDVYCRPIGWLGQYRHSSTTGLWYRGRHHWHLLGN
ncbi:hypothetical protein [Occultella aeris]|nr:hypothetical protein [Occultella aeris]